PPAAQSVEVTQEVDAAVATVEAEHTILPDHTDEPKAHVEEAALPLVLEPALPAPGELAVAAKRRRPRKTAAKANSESSGDTDVAPAGASAIDIDSEVPAPSIGSPGIIEPAAAESVAAGHPSSNGTAPAEIGGRALVSSSGERRGRGARTSTGRTRGARSAPSALPEVAATFDASALPAPAAPEVALEPAPPERSPILDEAASAPSPRRRRSAVQKPDASETAVETNNLPVQKPVRRKRVASATATADAAGAVQASTTS
ncbi:MAG TPA: hypothetical protein VMV93_08130, partial [Chloroflexota bacterium]|nr:hypothetical protein [Chloroflexota bacterium]